MISHISLIKAINTSSRAFFQESHFQVNLYKTGSESYYYKLDGSSKAINFRKNSKDEVSVLKWFRNFWIYIEFEFISEKTFISISVFQGENQNDQKCQLFRIEWDDYNNTNEKHPQPHWHITTDFAISESYKNYIGESKGDLFESFELVKADILDVKNIHFAMNGNWQNDESHFHKIESEVKIVKWFQGLLNHLRNELEYIESKKSKN